MEKEEEEEEEVVVVEEAAADAEEGGEQDDDVRAAILCSATVQLPASGHNIFHTIAAQRWTRAARCVLQRALAMATPAFVLACCMVDGG